MRTMLDQRIRSSLVKVWKLLIMGGSGKIVWCKGRTDTGLGIGIQAGGWKFWISVRNAQGSLRWPHH